jgi:hypothetical protein
VRWGILPGFWADGIISRVGAHDRFLRNDRVFVSPLSGGNRATGTIYGLTHPRIHKFTPPRNQPPVSPCPHPSKKPSTPVISHPKTLRTRTLLPAKCGMRSSLANSTGQPRVSMSPFRKAAATLTKDCAVAKCSGSITARSGSRLRRGLRGERGSYVRQLLQLREYMASRSGAGSAVSHLSRTGRGEVPEAIGPWLQAPRLTRSGGDGCRVSAAVPQGAQRAAGASRWGAAFAFLRRYM